QGKMSGRAGGLPSPPLWGRCRQAEGVFVGNCLVLKKRGVNGMFEGLSAYRPQALAALRIMTALLFIEHGTQKFFDFPPAEQPFGDLMNLIGVAGALEIVGGVLILLGLFTRPAALVLCGF